MSAFMKRYATDKSLETEGAWVDFGDGIRVKIARINNKEARAIFRREMKPYRNFRDGAPDEVSEKILTKVLVEAVIKAWEGVPADLADKEAAMAFLAEYPDFRSQVSEMAEAAETFRAENLKADEGN